MTSSGGQTSSEAQPANFSGNPFQGLRFLFRIDSLEPNFQAQEGQRDGLNRWIPPTIWNAYYRTQGQLYRWEAGTISPVLPDDEAFDDDLNYHSDTRFRCATVFTQSPWTQNYLAVDFDATLLNVCEQGYRCWYDIRFTQEESPYGPETAYSRVDLASGDMHLAGPSISPWVRELFPAIYRYAPTEGDDSPPVLAGLVGNLPIILALVAFSCPEDRLDDILTDRIRPGLWRGLPNSVRSNMGRERYRGMVVSVFIDPTGDEAAQNPEGLLGLENGLYGPFFRI